MVENKNMPQMKAEQADKSAQQRDMSYICVVFAN